MKNRNFTYGLLGFILLVFFSSILAKGATITSTTTVPTPDNADIYNLNLPATSSDILNGDRAAAGQTFLTSTSPLGRYLFSAVTVYNTRGVSTSGGTWNLRLGTVSGTTFTQTFSDTLTIGSNALTLSGSGGDYITFTLSTPTKLDSNTLYGIDLVRTGGGNWLQWGETSNLYSGGVSYTSPPNGLGGPTISTTATQDRIFLLDMVTIPEPSTLILGALGLMGLTFRRRHRK